MDEITTKLLQPTISRAQRSSEALKQLSEAFDKAVEIFGQKNLACALRSEVEHA